MNVEIRLFEPDDAPAVVRLWNRLYLYDQTDESQFIRIVTDRYCCDQYYSLTISINGQIQGMASVAIAGEKAYLRALAAESASQLIIRLIDRMADHLRTHGVSVIECCRFQGAYFFPGFDVRYGGVIDELRNSGFTEAEILYDAKIELSDWRLNRIQAAALERLRLEGVIIAPYTSFFEGQMRAFTARSEVPHWFPPGWEQDFRPHNTLIAHTSEAILGYARYYSSGSLCAFGPVAVLPTHQQNGIGTALLTTTMQDQQAQGVSAMTAHWVWPLKYYEQNGWHVDRTYIALQKRL